MTALRGQLAWATCADERLPVLAEMIELAAELRQAGGDDASAAAALDEALTLLREIREPLASAESPADDENYALTLYLIAQAGLLRDSGSDLDDAIACLRELRELLLAEPAEPADGLDVTQRPNPGHLADTEEIPDPEDPDPEDPDFDEIMAEVDVALGRALFARVQRPGGGVADLDGASAALIAALGWMASDAPGRLQLITALASQYATRYVGYSGTQDHRRAALALAAEGLASPDADEDTTAGCHVIVAWMTFTRQMTSEQRSTMLRQPEMEAVRRGESDAAAMIAAMGEVTIDPADAETALSHLRQISEGASLDADLNAIASTLSSLAHLAIMRTGRVSEDVDRVADQLQNAARQHPPDMIEQGELLGLRAALLAARASNDGYQDQLRPTAEALQEAAARLPAGHLVRGALITQLGQSLSEQVHQAGSADDVAGEIEQIVAALEQLPRDDPQFAYQLTYVATRVLHMQLSHRDTVPLDRLISQLKQTVSRLQPDDPMRSLGESMYWQAIGLQGSLQDRPDLIKESIDGLTQWASQSQADDVIRPVALLGVATVLIERYVMTGEIRHAVEADKYISQARAASGATGLLTEPNPGYPMLVHVRTVLAIARSRYDREDSPDTAEMIADLERAIALMKPDDELRPRLIASLESVRVMHHMQHNPAGPGIPLGQSRQAFDKILAEAQNINRDHADFPPLAAQAAAGLMLRALAEGDILAASQAISLMAEVCAVPGLTYRERPRMLNILGSVLLTRYHMSRNPRDLSLAIDRLEEARRAVEQELGSPYTTDVLQSLAGAYRIRGDAERGDVDRAVAIGLAALRERAGDVLLQDNDNNALRAARWATHDAGEMARWFLSRDRSGAAIAALELGRGIVLHAATSGAGLAEALEEAGHADLAAEWARTMSRGEAADSDAVGDLRYRIMLAIEGSPAEARLLAPPSLDDISAALSECGADALVYLLPRGEDGPGLAVLVDASGVVNRLSLPGLHAGAGSPVDVCLQARRAVAAAGEAKAGTSAVWDNWRRALDEQCDWAWRAAIGPVLDAVPARSYASRRLVLVPGGELGLVAWHAARLPITDSYRYAGQEAVFSYASSASQFVETARRQPRPWAEKPVLISDSEASLFTTADGIHYLHATHYPAAAVFGYARTVSGSVLAAPGADVARPSDVLDALPHKASAGASLLHFGCHGQAQVPVLTSHLKLGQESDGKKDIAISVAVKDILERARNRSGEAAGGLVVLASCLTDVAEADYDEALTIATAFLSAGASGVVAARWRVEDGHTALFMTVFHRYLNDIGQHPAQALRLAQLWMLDPGRTVPETWPKSLRNVAARPDLADPAVWAGFAYQGR
jgi:hypothetical protein